MKKLTIEQVAWVFRQIMDNAGKGTFRYLIYDRMGFKEDAYSPLYGVGGMAINNAMFVAYDKNKMRFYVDDFDFSNAYVDGDILIIPRIKNEIPDSK